MSICPAHKMCYVIKSRKYVMNNAILKPQRTKPIQLKIKGELIYEVQIFCLLSLR